MPSKDCDTLVEAARDIIKISGQQNVHFNLIGDMLTDDDRSYLDRLRNKVNCYQLDKWITFRGAVPYNEMHQYYQEADIVVSTSRTGSLDKVILEAMASHKPVITCLPLADLYGSYSSELIFAPGNYHELSEKLIAILNWDERKNKEVTDYFFKVTSENHSLAKLMSAIINEFRK